MAAHKRERKQAAVKGGTGFHVEREMDSRWNWGSLFTLGRCPRFTLSSFYVVLVLRWYRFTLASFYAVLVLRWYRFTLASFYGFTVEAGDAVTLRGC